MIYLSTSAKHSSPLKANKSVIDWTYKSPWFKEEENRYIINLKNDIDTVYFDFCQQLSKKPNKSIKNIDDLTAYNVKVRLLINEIELLKRKINSCHQFNKKVEFNIKLKEVEMELSRLNA